MIQRKAKMKNAMAVVAFLLAVVSAWGYTPDTTQPATSPATSTSTTRPETVQGNAIHIFYVIDPSADIDRVQDTTIQSLGRLKELQDFAIVVAQSDKPLEFRAGVVSQATDEFKGSAQSTS